MTVLPQSFYSRPTDLVARDLVGRLLVRTLVAADGRKKRLSGIIVETEAYGHAGNDAASHACRGPTPRNRMMFGPVGRAYVYFTYGAHHCVNVSARPPDLPAGAVLIRGIEPVEGADHMALLRGTCDARLLASGPGRLAQAMAITLAHNGLDMTDPDSGLWIEEPGSGGKTRATVATPRIGITKAADKSWRFVDQSSPCISRRLRHARTHTHMCALPATRNKTS